MCIGSKRIVAANALLLLALVVTLPAASSAGSRRLQPPPDVDLDPDRSMSFGRLPRTSFDQRVFGPLKQSLGSKAMDPAIDPYNPVVRPSRYEPGTGKIRDSLTDKVREMRRAEEARRPHRSSWARKDYASSSSLGRRSSSSTGNRPQSGASRKKSDD
jgi:hypothetical protein